MLDKQTADKILEWINAEDVEGEFIDTVRLRASSLEDYINSLVSEDISKSNHCVNCAIKWARQYETDTEIAERITKEYYKQQRRNSHNKEFWEAQENKHIRWLDKEGEDG